MGVQIEGIKMESLAEIRVGEIDAFTGAYASPGGGSRVHDQD
jgi:hypothetical protein